MRQNTAGLARCHGFLRRQELLEPLSGTRSTRDGVEGIGLAEPRPHHREGEDTMCRSTVMLGAIVALVVGGAPRAEAASEGKGMAVGFRVGFGLPGGLVEGGDGHRDIPMREVVTAIIPMQLDVGYFLNARVQVGAYLQYAPGILTRGCLEGSICGANALRLGANASYHLPWSDTLSPWLGLGIGTEFLAPSQVPSVIDGRPHKTDGAFIGLEFFNVQGGVDLHVRGPVWMGPFMTFTAGEYLGANDDAYHFWFIGGVRLQMRL